MRSFLIHPDRRSRSDRHGWRCRSPLSWRWRLFTPAGSSDQRRTTATSSKSTDPKSTSATIDPSGRNAIPGLSPQKLYDILGLQERGFSFEPPEPSNPGKWLFKLSIDGKTYEITVHGQNSNSVDWVEVKIDVMQGYDIDELTQSFFASIAGLGSSSESALAAQKWVKEHSNKSDAATFGALDFQITSDGKRQRKLIITASKPRPLGTQATAPAGGNLELAFLRGCARVRQ